MTRPLPANQRPINTAGVMRCCIATLTENDDPSMPGDVINCNWCSESLILNKHGVWEWNRKVG